MSYRIPNLAPIGSMFKKPGAYSSQKERKASDRQEDPRHLAAIRKLPCISCGEEPCGEAAHVRQASAAHGKRSTGMAMKADDKWTLPLCHECHMRQHSVGEVTFFYSINLSPFLVCEKLYALSPKVEAMREVVMSARSLTPAHF